MNPNSYLANLIIVEVYGKQLVGKIQEKYGIAQEEAEKQVDEWAESIKDSL